MKIRGLISVILLALPLPGMAEAADTVQAGATASPTDDICKQLIETTEGIETLLKRITDRETADAAAPQVLALQTQVRQLLIRLEDAPTDAATNRRIMQAMMTITHIAQRYLPTVTRLITEQAYGSEALLSALATLSSDAPYNEPPAPIPVPAQEHSRLISSMCSILGDVLYELRKTTDSATARAATTILRRAIATQKQLSASLAALPAEPPSGEEQQFCTANERLAVLRKELSEEAARLLHINCYDDPDLPTLMDQYILLLNR